MGAVDASFTLVIAAFERPDPLFEALLGAVETGLAHRGPVHVLDLYQLGFAPRLSPAERRGYHGNEPIVDPMVADHASLAGAASGMVFVFPTRWWQPPAILKAWLERVLVPGVAFVFDENHRVRPNLHRLDLVAGVTTYDMGCWQVRRVGDGSRRILLRALRANIPRRVKSSWSGLFNEPAAAQERRDQFVAAVARRMARL